MRPSAPPIGLRLFTASKAVRRAFDEALAIRTGVPPENVVLAEDGVVVDLVDGQATVTGKVPAGLVYVDGMTVGGATEASLKDRRTLAEEGSITIVCLVDADTGELTEAPDFLARGFVHDETTFTALVPLIEKALATAAKEGIGEQHRARTAHSPHRQPLGPRHLPAQPGHPADHHRRLTLVRTPASSVAGRRSPGVRSPAVRTGRRFPVPDRAVRCPASLG